MTKRYAHYVTVSGMGSFPIDMLRYDGLWPASESDSAKIVRTFPFSAEDGEGIRLMKHAEKLWTPTKERWASFLYEVVKHEVV